MKRVVAALALLGLAACGPRGSAEHAPAPASMEAALSESTAAGGAPAKDQPAAGDEAKTQPQQPGAAPGGIMLAYAYAYGLEAPAKQVSALMKAHQKICADAGAQSCQVLGATTSAEGEDDVSAQLSLRAEPHWLAQFRARLEGDAAKAGGKVKSTSTTTEDLTRSIVDTEANLRAQKTLRDRLQNLLASRPGKLSELLEVERELARVQGEIDSVESNLAVMQARVSMSLLTIDYASAGAPVTDTTFAPIKEALEKFVRTMAEGFGAMIIIVAALAPWALVLWLAGWLFLRWRRRRQTARFAPPPPAA